MRKLDYTTQTHSAQILTSLVSFFEEERANCRNELMSLRIWYGSNPFDDVLLRYTIERVIIDIDNVHNLQL